MKKELIERFRAVLEFCGYDYDEVMGNHCRRRILVDLRSIIFYICHWDKHLSASQIGEIFGWNRSTVFCSIEKVPGLCRNDRAFSNMYDSVQGAYMALGAKREEERNETEGM
jgi:chromosomal replication initiation ATPase DnaA